MRSYRQYLCAAALVLTGASVVFTYARARQTDVNLLCVTNAKRLAGACMAYAQDYDEKFPANMTQADIQNEVGPYVTDSTVFTCPATSVLYSPNNSLSGRSLAEFPDYSIVPLISDTVPHRDQKFTVAFLDGHVERGGKVVDPEDPNVECVSNVRAQALGILMYSQDYDETLPPMNSEDQLKSSIYPYVKNSRAFVCPATRLPYTPNAALSGTLLSGYPYPATIVSLRDTRKHKDRLITTGYLDGHVERIFFR